MLRSCLALATLLVAACPAVWAAEATVPAGYRLLAETPDAQYDLLCSVSGEQPITLLIAAQEPLRGYRLKLGPEGSLLERLNGETSELARAGRAWTGPGPHQVTIRRRESALYVVVNGRLLLSALHGADGPGVAAVAAAEQARVKLAENGYQPVEDIYFTDDFMRTKDQQQLGVWHHASGKWRFYSVLETNERADVKLSVNPFSLGLDSEGTTPAMVTTGHPFWCDYNYSASLRSRGGGWAGLVFSQRGDNDYFLLRADLRERPVRPRRIELVRVRPSGETVLAGGTTLLSAEQWYRLGVSLRGSRLQCLLDESVVFDRVEPECVGGPVGLWSQGNGAETLFDDVRCETNLSWPFERQHDLAGGLRQGAWRVEAAGGRIGNDPGPRRLVSEGRDEAWFVLGDPVAQSYRLDAVVEPAGHGRVSILFGWRDRRNFYYGQWSTAEGRLAIGRVTDGVAKPLGLVTDRLEPGKSHTIALDLLTDGRVQLRRDGLLRMRATVAEAPVGRFGVATDGTAATFGDLLVRQAVPIDTEVEVDNANFAGDPFMLHWASSLADWFPQGTPAQDASGQQVYWHKGDFYRAYRLTIPVKASTAVLLNATEEKWLPPADPLVESPISRVEEIAEKQHAGDGYALHVVVGKQRRLYLLRQGVPVKDAALPDDAESITIGHDGGVTWVEGGEGDLLVYHDHQPLRGARVALRVKGNDELYHVKCRREGIIDEVFERAPAAWLQQGHWEITNRFSCTPTWSHMTALERKGLGALWHKAAFPGNVTIEYYAGMRMQSDFSMIYPRPGDFNTTFAAQPLSLESGISLLPGAWDRDWSSTLTRFARGDQSIVETDRPLVPRTREDGGQRYIPVPYISAGRDIHGAWYYVKSRYVDGHLEGYFDNVKVLDGTAPAVEGDRVAMWTQDNQVVLARVRITYEQKLQPNRLIEQEAVAPTPSFPPAAILTAREAPGVAFDFEQSVGGWAPRDNYRGVLLEQGSDEGRRYLVARNQLPGDSFEVVMPLGDKKQGQWESLDLSRAAELRFDYRLPAETKVNAYLTLNGRRFVVPLTGSQEDSPVTPVLARLERVVADGKWQTARLALGAALRGRFGKQAVSLTDFRFGNLQEGYLLAGFGGNPRGAWLALDNLVIASEATAEKALTPTFTLLPADAQQPSMKALRLSLDRNPRSQPPGEAPTPPTVSAEPGWYYLHAQGQLPDGSLTTVAHLPLVVVAPKLTDPTATPAWDGGPLQIGYGESCPTDLTVTVNDKTLTWDQAVQVMPEQGLLRIDPAAASLSLADGQAVSLKLVASYAGGQKAELTVNRVYSRSADQLPPLPPTVGGLAAYQDMEQGRVPWSPSSPEATAVELDSSSSPEPGGTSLKVTNLQPSGNLGVTLLTDDVNVGQAPVLMFDYKMPAPVRSDLLLYFPGDYYSIGFTDHAGSYAPLTSVPEVARDRGWHRAMVPLQQALARHSDFSPTMYNLKRLLAADYGYSGAAPGAAWWLDNLRFVRVVGKRGTRLTWSASDPGGIARYRLGISENEQAEPTEEVEGTVTARDFVPAKEGLSWFAVQACDQAGNWSRVTRVPLMADLTPPAFGAPTPAPGAIGSWDLEVPVSGLGTADLDPASLRLTAAGKTVPVREGEVVYRSGKPSLHWLWAWSTKQFSGKVGDGTKVAFGLSGSDLAGNEAAAATWQHTITYAADKQPPLPPDLTLPKQPLGRLNTCTTGLGQLDYQSSSYRSPREWIFDPERQDYVCQVTTSGSGVPLHYGEVDLTTIPYLSFDYKLNPGVAVHLLVYIDDTYYSIKLSGKSRSYRQIGEIGVVADGKWHTLVADLQALARTVRKSGPLPLKYLFLDETGSNGGRTYAIDNVALTGPVAKESIEARWVNYDCTGIQGGAATIGPLHPTSEPAAPTAITADQSSVTLKVDKPGIYLLQVRSKDGAGNLGAVARRVVVAK
ncbi:MAG: hypothetical protein HUU35_00600 [Armatimonadetes bacterium]|nr:hypothetical protein [Armatimonadota bacterium]